MKNARKQEYQNKKIRQNTKITIYKWDKIKNEKIQRQQNTSFVIWKVGPGSSIEN